MGDSTVTVRDLAAGGATASILDVFPGEPAPMVFGAGGNADSTATAETAGGSAAFASSSARGGDGGLLRVRNDFFSSTLLPAGRGGSARAGSTSIGRGESTSVAEAVAGRSFGMRGGEATALASATGTSGSASARAEASSQFVASLSLENRVGLESSVTVKSQVGLGSSAIPDPAERDLRATSTLLPQDGSIAAALNGQPAEVLRQTLAITDFEVVPGAGSGSDLETTLRLFLDTADDFLIEELRLTLENGQGEGEGFESLILTVLRADITILEASFSKLEDVESFFNGTVLELGDRFDALPDPRFPPTFPPDADPLTVQLAWTSGASDWNFRGSVEISGLVTPEPGTGLLLGLGLIFLARLRSVRARKAGGPL